MSKVLRVVAEDLKEALKLYMDNPTANIKCQKTVIELQDCNSIEDAMEFYQGARPKPLRNKLQIKSVCDKCNSNQLDFVYNSSDDLYDNIYIDMEGEVVYCEKKPKPTLIDIRGDIIRGNKTDVRFFCDVCDNFTTGEVKMNGATYGSPEAAFEAFINLKI